MRLKLPHPGVAFSGIALGALIFTSADLFAPKPMSAAPEPAPPVVQPVVAAAPVVDAFAQPAAWDVEEVRIQRGETFSDLLGARGVSPARIAALASASHDVHSVRALQAGRRVRIYSTPEGVPARLVYLADAVRYVVFDVEAAEVSLGEREVEIAERSVEGTIDGSLYETLVEGGADPMLATALAEVFAWQIDFYRIQRGDAFRVVFEERVLDGEGIGIENVLAARFTHRGEDYNAYYYENDESRGYYDEHGESLRKAFLISPVKFARISSRYNLRRFHPVQRRTKAHLGTDYAAAHGTAIRSTGDGVVTEARRTRYNGNYVKIRHNGTYETQYLHMSRIGKDIKPGTRVRQGDTIGYVGSTGLATGPHVCYRFWKNGKQVDHLKERFPSANPVPEAYRAEFAMARQALDARLRDPQETIHVALNRLGVPSVGMQVPAEAPQAL